MQNISNLSYIGSKKVINMRSEVLFREAEDDFFYFNKINSALKKLEEAVKLTPSHTKSLMMCADIYFMKGNIKKALVTYQNAYLYGQSGARCIAAISNCFYALKDYEQALMWVDKALNALNREDYSLYSQLIEIKINVLVEMKRYKQAYVVFIQSQNVLDIISLKNIYNSNYELINEKLQLQKKLRASRLQIV